MVILSHPPMNQILLVNTCKPTPATSSFNGIPEIDLSDPQAKTLIVRAAEELGFFKLVNHGVPLELMTNLENEATRFFRRPQAEKDKAGPPDPFGYGSKIIGCKGDVGWVEYLLLNANPEVVSPKSLSIFQENHEIFRSAVEEYMSAVKRMSCWVLELMAEGLGLEERDAFSRLVRDERSDCCLRVNHYPPWEEEEEEEEEEDDEEEEEGGVVGFGEHTDPQLISVLRSNNTSGLQICARDGSWVSVPSDHKGFFINVGDSLQVLTNGRLRSVKHRVLADRKKSRVSMIYFGGPPLSEKLAPLPSFLLPSHPLTLYREFTWCEYKTAAYNSKLSDDRLSPFLLSNSHNHHLVPHPPSPLL